MSNVSYPYRNTCKPSNSHRPPALIQSFVTSGSLSLSGGASFDELGFFLFDFITLISLPLYDISEQKSKNVMDYNTIDLYKFIPFLLENGDSLY